MSTTNIFDMADTWNDAGADFCAIRMNVTDTASGAGSSLMDLLVGGSSRFNVSPAGNAIFTGTDNTTLKVGYVPEPGSLYSGTFPAPGMRLQSTGGRGVEMLAEGYLPALMGVYPGTIDFQSFAQVFSDVLAVYSDDGGELEINAKAGQLWGNGASWKLGRESNRFSETYTDKLFSYNTLSGGNWERGFTQWVSNVFRIGTERAGTGVARAMAFWINALERMRIADNGFVGIGTASPGALLDLATTWNAAGTSFRGLRLAVTNTASASSSLLMDLLVGGSSRFNVSPAGNAMFTGTDSTTLKVGYVPEPGSLDSTFPAPGMRLESTGDGGVIMFAKGERPAYMYVRPGSDPALSYSEIYTDAFGLYTNNDLAGFLVIVPAECNIEAYGPWKLGIPPSRFSETYTDNLFLYNSYTNSGNWERGAVTWVSNAMEISTQRAGTGVARPIIFRTNGSNRLQIGANGTITAALAASQNFIITGLPTTNPAVAGALWNDGGTVKISAG